jgi:hypothetical protein
VKGIELPINILVVVAVAVIVLLGLVALYFSGFMGPAGVMNQESAKQKYCALVMRSPDGCAGGVALSSITVSDFDADRDGSLDAGTTWDWATSTCGAGASEEDNLAALLACYFGVTSERDGLLSCGCAI